MPLEEHLSMDTLFNGDVAVFQSRKGYRFSIDSVLLADLVSRQPGETLLDIGCGSAVMPLIIARKNRAIRSMVGVEIQDELAVLATRSVRHNTLQDRISILHADVRGLTAPLSENRFDLIISNPPYTPLGHGRLNPLSQKAICRHEVTLTLDALLDVVVGQLAPKGTFSVVYPVERKEALLKACAKRALYPSILRHIHYRPDDSASRILLSCQRFPCELDTAPALTVHRRDGSLTDEVANMFTVSLT